MPNSNKDAAADLSRLLKATPGLTARRIAKELGVTEAWLSRRLNTNVPMSIDDYSNIRKAIVEAASLTVA